MTTQPEHSRSAWGRPLAVLGAMVILYPLSMGPALWCSGAKRGEGWRGVPEPIRSIYLPLASIPLPEPVTRAFEQYLNLWMTR